MNKRLFVQLQNYALVLQGEKRNVGYHGRLPKGKGQPTTQSWAQSAMWGEIAKNEPQHLLSRTDGRTECQRETEIMQVMLYAEVVFLLARCTGSLW